MDVYGQPGHRVRLREGRSGAADAASAGDALVVVDVLSFSTGVVTAVARGARIRPCAWGEDPRELAQRLGAECAVQRQLVPAEGRFSLSPDSLRAAGPDDRIVLRSPNGATCVRYANEVPAVWVAALVNATATSAAVHAWLGGDDDRSVTVLACGERWLTEREDGPLRPALEDRLGAGAVLDGLERRGHDLSPEARAAAATFRSAGDDLAAWIAGCASGLELIEMGFPQDPAAAARLDAERVVVRLGDDGWLCAEHVA